MAKIPKKIPQKKPNAIPAGLTKQVDKQVHAKTVRLAREGRDDIALIKRRRQRITEDFYDMGEALLRLKRPGVVAALKYNSFGELCEKELAISRTKAAQLLQIVQHVRRTDAVSIGQDRASALIELADATPDNDAPADLRSTTLKLPSGREIHTGAATTREIREAAREIRAARAVKNKSARGLSVSTSDRSAAKRLESALRKAGLERAVVAAVATRPGAGADVRIEHVPLEKLDALRKAIADVKPAGKKKS